MPDQLTRRDIDELAASHEGPTLEYKREFPKQADDVARKCAGLANSGGGTFLLGVEDDGNVMGVPSPAKTYDTLAKMLRNCDPPIEPTMGWVAVAPDRGVVYARMAPGRHLYRGVFYVRNGTATEVGTIEQLDRAAPALAHAVLPEQFSPPTSEGFRGRSADLEELQVLLSARRGIVIVDGISGIGKTALLAAFAASLVDRPVCWMECTAEASFGNLIEAFGSVARAKGLHPLADAFEDPHGAIETRLQRCAAALAGSDFLLILDDYHLVTDPLLDRFVLRVTERATYPKLFLACRWRPKFLAALPRRIKEHALEDGLDVETCRLLLLDEGIDVDVPAAKRIWRLTGEGHPKALELFIGRTRTYTVDYLLDRLPPFQEDLKAQWLQPLLEEVPSDARSLAIAFSVFSRPVPLAALPSLFPEISNLDGTLTELLDRFLLNRGSLQTVKMHPLVREFCYDHIDDRDAAHARAATYYLNALPETPALGEGEIETLTAAWSHLLKAKEYDRAGALINTWRGTLLEGGYFEELMFIIDNSTEIFSDREREQLQTRLLLDRARILSAWGESAEAVSILSPLTEEAMTIALVREAVLILATVHADAGDLSRAQKVLEDHQRHFREDCPAKTKRRYLARFADILAREGDLPRAFRTVKQLVELCEAERDNVGGARALRQLADVLFQQKNNDLAASVAAHSLALGMNLREKALTRVLLGRIEKARNDPGRAREHLQEALESFTRMRDRRNASASRSLLGSLSSS
jgi:ATP/maltotriose-dependent transcriptional regulator MalT